MKYIYFNLKYIILIFWLWTLAGELGLERSFRKAQVSLWLENHVPDAVLTTSKTIQKYTQSFIPSET